MLKNLTINNYALIESLDISFPNGLIIITGETGAGKSILLGALSLLLGAKADISVIKDTSKNCVVEAVFDNDLIIRRVISPSGRSRAFIDDSPVTLAELSEKASLLIDIHAQHQHLLLSNKDYQLSVLDYFSNSRDLLKTYQLTYKEYKSLEEDLDKAEAELQKNISERDYISFQWEQLDSANLKPGELEELEQEQKALANAENIKESLRSVISALNPMDIPLSQYIKDAISGMGKSSSYLSSLKDLSSRLDSCRIELNDIESEVESIAEGIIISPERLSEVDERLSLIYGLMKKHGTSDIESLISIKDGLDASLLDSSILEERIDSLKKEKILLYEKLVALSDELYNVRSSKLDKLSKELSKSIRSLEMPMAEFTVKLTHSDTLGFNGADNISFLFSANGTKPSDVSKVASGGELSRVMLSLKALMATYASLPTMIFDEIDTGVSGKVADKMGTMIGDMAENMQILAITHLPQIASKKGSHFYVYKEFGEDNIATTKIKQLSVSEREIELAKMLSGSVLSEAALENARVLLKENNN